MRIALSLACICILTGCSIKQGPPPYVGLTKNSYGSLSRDRDSQTHEFIPVSSCDQSGKHADIASELTTKILAPFTNRNNIDQAIINQDMQDKFRLLADPSGMPTVVILTHGESGILFWYTADFVHLSEVANAAMAYCQKYSAKIVYEGSSRKCGTPKQMAFAVNGKRATLVETYAISSFQCVASSAAQRR